MVWFDTTSNYGFLYIMFPFTFLDQKSTLLWNLVTGKFRISLRTYKIVEQCFRKLIIFSLIFQNLKGELGLNIVTLILIKEGTNFNHVHFIKRTLESIMITEFENALLSVSLETSFPSLVMRKNGIFRS